MAAKIRTLWQWVISLLALLPWAPSTGFAQSVHSVADQPGGSQSAAGSVILVDQHIACKAIHNTSTSSFFVPWKTADEWAAFRTNLPSGVTLSDCCAPATVTECGTAKDVNGPRVAGKNIPAFEAPGYGINGDVVTITAGDSLSVTYTCQSGTWNRTAETGNCTDPMGMSDMGMGMGMGDSMGMGMGMGMGDSTGEGEGEGE